MRKAGIVVQSDVYNYVTGGRWLDQYARKECDRCQIVLPANQMVRRSGTTVTGRSESVSQQQDGWRYGQFYQARPAVNSTTTHYRRRTYWLCGPCDARRRAEVRTKIVVISMLFGLGLLMLAFLPNRAPPQVRAANPPQFDAEVQTNAEYASEEEEALHAMAPVEESIQDAARADQAAADADDAETLLSQLPDMLAAHIQKALRNNEMRLWQMNGMRGYVLLSEEPVTASGCKNVVVTLITGDIQRQSTPRKWCRTSDQREWVPS